jgi:DNA-binding NarL/FixJ family response regulator
LHAVAAGKTSFPATLVDDATKRTLEVSASIAKVEELLTPREIEVMLKVAGGLSNKDVGSELDISEGTVKIHLHSIYSKIGVTNRTSLANYAGAYRDRFLANRKR